MNEIVYEELAKYYHILELKGYWTNKDSMKLLILSFYVDFITTDFRGILSREDYRLIEKVLDSLYGTSRLIPYPDYLKMGSLYLGELAEMTARIKALEEANVVKTTTESDSTDEELQSDVEVIVGDDDE